MPCPSLQLPYSTPVLLLANSCLLNVTTTFMSAPETRDVFISILFCHQCLQLLDMCPIQLADCVKCSAHIQVGVYSVVPCLIVRFSQMGKKKKSLCFSSIVSVSNHCQQFSYAQKLNKTKQTNKQRTGFALANTTCFLLIHWVLETKFKLYSPYLPTKMGCKQLLTQFKESTDCSQQTCNSIDRRL